MKTGKRFARIVLLGGVAAASAFAQVSAPLPAAVPQVVAHLEHRFPNGVAAVVGDRLITVSEVATAVAPALATLAAEKLGQAEFRDRLSQLEDEATRQRIDRARAVAQFKNAGRQIPASQVDTAFAGRLAKQFGGDRSRLLAHLRARGKTLRALRADIEEDLLLQSIPIEERK